ncbi:MAG: 2-dehydro-3-deoxygalactonokinase [Bauldia sp.]
MSPHGSYASGALILGDWGTSRLRLRLATAEGRIIGEAESGDGINTIPAGGHEAAFEKLVHEWPAVPVILSGMVGSRQGWREAPYVETPATPGELATQLVHFSGNVRPIVIVPGIVRRAADGAADVMRGEETQIVGLLDRDPHFAGVAILPGTHSKWARIAAGGIAGFQTYLTGEMFDLLAHHSFLRHSVAEGAGDVSARPDFALGVRRTAVEGVPFLATIFSVRTRQLLDNVAREENLAYLSGLVIGGEIAAAIAAGLLPQGTELRIIGARSLARAYLRAFEILGRRAEALDGGGLVTAGLLHLARAAGLVGGRAT